MLDLKAYLNHLASAEPTPGGGSAAALVGAFGAALVAMVARITLGSAKHAGVHADALLLVARADALRSELTAARPRDETAYAAVVAAQASPRRTDAEREARAAALQTALIAAAQAPLDAAALCAAVVDAAADAAALGNTHLSSDVVCALAFGTAALEASAANVRINHRFIKASAVVAEQAGRLEAVEAAAAASAGRARALLGEA